MTMTRTTVEAMLRPPLLMVLVFLVTIPALTCIRWAVYALPLERPSVAWLKRAMLPGNALRLVGFFGAVVFSTLLLGNVVDGVLGSDEYHYWTMALLLLMTLSPIALGVVYSVSSTSTVWPEPVRLHPDLAPASSAAAACRAARRVWLLAFSQAAVVSLTVVFCAFRFAIYNEQKDPSGFFTLVGLVLTVLVGIGVGLTAVTITQNYAMCLTLLNRVRWDQIRSRQVPNSVDGAALDPLGGTRADLHQLARRIETVARRSGGNGVTYPVQHLLGVGSSRIGAFLQSSRSLERTVPAEFAEVLTALGNILVGDCRPGTHQRLARELEAFDDDGAPVQSAPRRTSRAGRIWRSMTQHAEPADKLLSTATRMLAVVLIAVLAVTGKLGLDKILEQLK